MEGVFQVYILKGASTRYIGCTSDLPSRINAHDKRLSTFTKKGGPWALEWSSIAMSHSEALALEKKMKDQKGGDGLHTLMKAYRGS